MPLQRSVYRIEEFSRPRAKPAASSQPDAAQRHREIMAELSGLRALLEASLSLTGAPPAATPGDDNERFKDDLGVIYDAIQQTKQEIAALAVTGFGNPEMNRVTQELNAVVGGTESATHRILEAGEEIEESAKTLAAAIKNIQDQNLARDILDQVTHIFEACNFQDLAGQRIAKVTATLKFIEDHVRRLMEIWGGAEQFDPLMPAAKAERDSHPKLINGPRLDSSDRGYVSQKEIDAMFTG